MRTISGIVSRRHTIVALTGAAAVLTALVGSPAHAFVAPPTNTPGAASGTLALCVGAQQGATGYIYAEGVAPQGNTIGPGPGMDLIPSQFTQLLAGSGGLDCRAYPADPGSYEIRTYKFPQAPCTASDQTRPTNNPAQPKTPAGECLAKVHHIHIIHMNGAVTSVDASGNPSLNGTAFSSTTPWNPTLYTDGTSTTPECATGVTPAIGSSTACGAGDGHDFGMEYTTELLSVGLPEDTVIDAQTVTVEVVAHETTEVITHLPDHETDDCFSSFGPDVNGNLPVCN